MLKIGTRSLFLLLMLNLFSFCSKKESISEVKEFEGYVIAHINGDKIRADYKPILGDPVYNAYYKSEKNILFSRRLNSKQKHGYRIEIKDVNLDQVNFPLKLQHNTSGNPSVNFAYIDENDSLWQMNIAAPMMFELNLEKYQNNRIYGTFEGILYQSMQDSLVVKEGKFEIELKIY